MLTFKKRQKQQKQQSPLEQWQEKNWRGWCLYEKMTPIVKQFDFTAAKKEVEKASDPYIREGTGLHITYTVPTQSGRGTPLEIRVLKGCGHNGDVFTVTAYIGSKKVTEEEVPIHLWSWIEFRSFGTKEVPYFARLQIQIETLTGLS